MKKSKLLSCMKLLSLLTFIIFSACKKDTIDSKDLIVYMPGEFGSTNNTVTIPLVHTPLSVIGNTIAKVAPRATREAATDIDITIAADTSLVSQYNKKNNKNCLLLPASNYTLTSSTLKIKTGSVTADSLQVEITHPEQLKNPGGYVLPLNITRIDGKDKGVLISSNQGAAYINITYEFNNIEPTQVPLNATVITRTAWSVTVSNTTAGALGPAMLDASNSTAWRSSNSSTAAKWVIVDMGSAQAIKGFRLTPNYAAVAENPTTILLSTSTDNLTFTPQGTWKGTGPAATSSATSPDIKGINFIAPVTARYYRFDITSQTSGSRVGIGEMNAVQ